MSLRATLVDLESVVKRKVRRARSDLDVVHPGLYLPAVRGHVVVLQILDPDRDGDRGGVARVEGHAAEAFQLLHRAAWAGGGGERDVDLDDLVTRDRAGVL